MQDIDIVKDLNINASVTDGLICNEQKLYFNHISMFSMGPVVQQANKQAFYLYLTYLQTGEREKRTVKFRPTE